MCENCFRTPNSIKIHEIHQNREQTYYRCRHINVTMTFHFEHARNNVFSVRAFIEAGVDPNEANSQGKTCIDMTQNDGTRKLLKKLKEEL